MNFELILKYFPELSDLQKEQFRSLGRLYPGWNERINVISRKDIGNLYERHILHSLAIARIVEFLPGARVLDAGTGGGFPGIPLAILFPETYFHLVDSTAKKLHVVQKISEEAGLDNVSTWHGRLEDLQGNYDFVVSRAVSTLPEFYKLVHRLISDIHRHTIANGVLYLKGGDVEQELGKIKDNQRIYNISDFFSEEFFVTKKIIHLWKE